MSLPTINMEKTGQNIRRLRKQAKLSVSQIANMMMIGNQSIYHWEIGARMPSLDNLVILAEVLDVKVEEILAIEKGDLWKLIPRKPIPLDQFGEYHKCPVCGECSEDYNGNRFDSCNKCGCVYRWD